MANLRTNNLCGDGGRNAYNGSVFFAGDASTRLDLDGSSNLAFGTGDFTIEMWIKIDDDTNTNTIYDSRPSGSNGDQVALFYSGGTNAVLLANNGTVRITGSVDVGTDHAWHHIALTRSSGSTKLFVDGVQDGSTYSDSTDYENPSNRPRIGSSSGSTDLSATSAFKGYISNVRVQKGEALYTADFTPPTTELTANENTVLLCCQDSDNPLKEETGRTITGGGAYEHLNDTELVTNGSGTTTTGWTNANTSTFTVENGMIKVTRSGGSGPTAYQTITTETGQQYTVSANIQYVSGNYADLRVYNGSDSTGTLLKFLRSTGTSTDGNISSTFTAESTSTTLFFVFDDGGDTGKFSQISVKAADRGKQPKVIPPYGVDAGNTFNGAISMNSPSYMYFPTGRTEERGRGRGLIVANYIQPSNYNTCEFITIQSMGNSIDFGDAAAAVRGQATLASSTRAVSGSGYVAPSVTKAMEFFTIATRGNSTSFGTIQGPGGDYTPISNQTRGIFAGGYAYPNMFNAIDFITIASLGNSTDFGDMTTNRANGNRSAINSSTRGLIGGGFISPAGTNNIEFLTIATTGNSQDFGDLTSGRGNFTGLCSSTRGVFAGGSNPNNNIIDFVTIASAGNASDFGDMFTGNSVACCSTSNNLRGVIMGGDLQPSNAFTNTMQHVTIATTGNAQDFGDMLTVGAYRNATSDSHGGLS